MSITRRDFLLFAATGAGLCMARGVSPAFAVTGGPGQQGDDMMKQSTAAVVHFSPTGSTAAIAGRLGAALADRVREIDLTGQTLESYSFGPEPVVVAVPVFSGRVPARAVEALRQCSGGGARCVSVVVCGNRAIDDALLELNDVLAEQGFAVAASAAFVARHSMVEEVAAGRPDDKDWEALDAFAAAVLPVLASARTPEPPAVPGERPYKTPPALPVTPLTSEDCIECGECAKRCPVSAIPPDSPRETVQGQCIVCMRCVRICPTGARGLPAQLREAVLQRLGPLPRLEPKSYIS